MGSPPGLAARPSGELSGAATLTLVLATLLSSQGDTSRSFQEAEYDKTFANSNQTKVRTRKCME